MTLCELMQQQELIHIVKTCTSRYKINLTFTKKCKERFKAIPSKVATFKEAQHLFRLGKVVIITFNWLRIPLYRVT